MHSSRMRTTRSLPYRGGLCPGGGGLCPGGGLCLGGDLCLGVVSVQGVSVYGRGSLSMEGLCPGGSP